MTFPSFVLLFLLVKRALIYIYYLFYLCVFALLGFPELTLTFRTRGISCNHGKSTVFKKFISTAIARLTTPL